MEIKTLPTGPLETNCYLVYLEDCRHLYIIDPGADAGAIIDCARKFDAQETAILLTHAHADHIGAAGKVAAALDVKKTWLGSEDKAIYDSPENQIYPYYMRAEDRPDTCEFDPAGDFTVIRLPGHSPGGTGFLFRHGEKPALFVGDTIFESSVGRTDLWGGSFEILSDSIRKEIYSLENDLILYPGHGGITTVGREKTTNPYVS